MPRPVHIMATVWCWWACAADAHEHWIRMAKTDGDASVQICSGHTFPASELLLAERLLADTVIGTPEGKTIPFKPEAADKTWTAEFVGNSSGVWSASFALKKPQEAESFYRGRCLMVVGNVDDPSRYAAGQGLEIVPQASLATLKPGDSLPVAIHWNGTAIEGRIAVTSENGSASFFSTGRERPAAIKLPSAGVYLLTASHKGKTFSLTFSVLPPERNSP